MGKSHCILINVIAMLSMRDRKAIVPLNSNKSNKSNKTIHPRYPFRREESQKSRTIEPQKPPTLPCLGLSMHKVELGKMHHIRGLGLGTGFWREREKLTAIFSPICRQTFNPQDQHFVPKE